MTHYEKRLEKDIVSIREHVDALAEAVVDGMTNAIRALMTGDEKLASDVILADGPINRAMREIDAMCHSFIAVHLPSGKHLRLTSSIIRINITLERIGDYAVTIAREFMQLSGTPDGAVANGIEKMSTQAMDILSQALDAFKRDDAERARQTMKLSQKTVALFDDVLAELVKEQDKRNITDMFALFVVFHHLVRVSDQSKNICEDTVFAVTGEIKAKKIYKVLFVDEDNSCLSQMARAIGNKSHSYGGIFSSAGRNPATDLHPGLADFMDQHGVDMEAIKPQSITDVRGQLDDYHVIVSLKGSARSYIDKIPFHTTLLDWNIGEAPGDEIDDICSQRFEDVYRDLAVRIQDLMLLLRGEEATES